MASAKAGEVAMRRGHAGPVAGGFSLIELLVTISIIAVLAGLLLPAVQQVKRGAQSAQCASNLRQMTMAVIAYASDNNGLLVSYRVDDVYWYDNLAAYAGADSASGNVNLKAGNVFTSCPAWRTGAKHYTDLGYGMPHTFNVGTSHPFWNDWYWNGTFTIRDGTLHELTLPSSRILIGESAVKYIEAGGNPAVWGLWNSYKYDQALWSAPAATPPANPVRHSGRANYAFVDGHVQSLGPLTSPWGYVDPSRLNE